MSTVNQISVEYFRHDRFKIFKDRGDQLVPILSADGLEGYLVYDHAKRQYAQIRFIETDDSEKCEAIEAFWRHMSSSRGSTICPRILYQGVFEGVPFYISELPTGEPISQFIKRNGTIPAENAALIVLDFIRALRKNSPRFYQKFALAPESVWVTRTSAQPNVVLGEYFTVADKSPEKHNFELCFDLLRYLTDESDAGQPYFYLTSQLEKGKQRLPAMEEALDIYTQVNPAPNYWMGFNEPNSVIEGVVAPDSSKRSPMEGLQASIYSERARKSIWPGIVGVATLVALFLTFKSIMMPIEDSEFVYLDESEYVENVAPQRPEPRPVAARKPQPVVQRSQSRPIIKRNSSPPVVKARTKPPVISRPAPRKVIPKATASSSSPAGNYYTEPVSDADAPEILKSLLADTGDLFKEMFNRETSEWLVFEDDGKRQLTETFTDEDARMLEQLKMKKAASEARLRNEPFTAIMHEVAILKIAPDSVDSRIRLHDDLDKLQNAGTRKVTAQEIQILVEASRENAKARDILYNHYDPNSGKLF